MSENTRKDLLECGIGTYSVQEVSETRTTPEQTHAVGNWMRGKWLLIDHSTGNVAGWLADESIAKKVESALLLQEQKNQGGGA